MQGICTGRYRTAVHSNLICCSFTNSQTLVLALVPSPTNNDVYFVFSFSHGAPARLLRCLSPSLPRPCSFEHYPTQPCDQEEGLPFIRLTNAGEQLVGFKTQGVLCGRVMQVCIQLYGASRRAGVEMVITECCVGHTSLPPYLRYFDLVGRYEFFASILVR